MSWMAVMAKCKILFGICSSYRTHYSMLHLRHNLMLFFLCLYDLYHMMQYNGVIDCTVLLGH